MPFSKIYFLIIITIYLPIHSVSYLVIFLMGLVRTVLIAKNIKNNLNMLIIC
jgi:hypothetical protein